MDIKKYYKKGSTVYKLNLNFKKSCPFPSVIAIDIYGLFTRTKKLNEKVKLLTTQPNVFDESDTLEFNYLFFFASENPFSTVKDIIKSQLINYKDDLEKVAISKYSNEFIEERTSRADDETELDKIEKSSLKVKHKADTIRVDVEKAEELGNLVGELISSKIQIDSYINSLVSEGSHKNAVFDKLKKVNKQLGNITDRLRDLSLGIRMVPISNIFRKFPRMVRDFAKQKNKKINMLVLGEDTELDKTLIDEISDPLMHLIRNSVDHGIETREARELAKKSPSGKINLKAYNEGNSIIIEVEDDGHGLDIKKIKQKAVEKQLISKEKADKISDKEAIEFIFAPGFSTADSVSDISGRGVGMDVVKTNIEKLNGLINVESKPGKGVKFILKMPLTLSIIQVLLVKDLEEIYAIPFYSILETSSIDEKKAQDLGNYHILEKNNQAIPIFKLGNLFKLNGNAERETPYLIELGVSLGQYGITVEEVIGQHEIVIKSLGKYLGKVKGISGATTLSDGRITLIVDVKSLSEMIRKKMDKEIYESNIVK